MASLWKTLDDFSMALSTASLGNNSMDPDRGELHKSTKDSNEILSLTLVRTASRCFK